MVTLSRFSWRSRQCVIIRPLKPSSRFDADPLIGAVGALSNPDRGEVGWPLSQERCRKE